MSLRDPWASHPAGLQGLGTSVLTVAGPPGDVSVLQLEKLAQVKPKSPSSYKTMHKAHTAVSLWIV